MSSSTHKADKTEQEKFTNIPHKKTRYQKIKTWSCSSDPEDNNDEEKKSVFCSWQKDKTHSRHYIVIWPSYFWHICSNNQVLSQSHTKEIIKFPVIPPQTGHGSEDSVEKMDRRDRLTDKLHQRHRGKERYTGQHSWGFTCCSVYRSCYTEDCSTYWNSCILRATKNEPDN